MDIKLKVLSLTNIIPEYRIPVYNQLCEFFDITVAHHGKLIDKNKTKFSQISLSKINVGPFIIFKENVHKIAKNYDVVIALGDLHYLPYIYLGLKRNRPYSLVYWSIGVSASYNKRFDEDRKLDIVRFKLMNKADSLIFYSDYPIDRYVNDGGIDKNKLFVAHNTVSITDKIDVPSKKKYFIFVGTLYKAKKIFDLLEAYRLAYQNNNKVKPLVIIGDGDEYTSINTWIDINNLNSNIKLKGAIYDQNVLKNYFKEAIACISPGQAGLTVLNSMAYGVPFITTNNSITGGEIFNISNNVNGILYDDGISKLSEIIIDLSFNETKVHFMSTNAQSYYFSKRNINIMSNGIKSAIEFAISNKRQAKYFK